MNRQRESTSLLGGGGNWHGFGGGNADFGSSDFQSTIIGEAVKAAVEKTSTEVIADKDKLVARTVTVEGLIAAVDGGQIILNVGSKAGVKVGDQLNVERVSKEIKDPSTGKVIRRMATSVGVIKVTDVDDISVGCDHGFRHRLQNRRRGENGHPITNHVAQAALARGLFDFHDGRMQLRPSSLSTPPQDESFGHPITAKNFFQPQLIRHKRVFMRSAKADCVTAALLLTLTAPDRTAEKSC